MAWFSAVYTLPILWVLWVLSWILLIVSTSVTIRLIAVGWLLLTTWSVWVTAELMWIACSSVVRHDATGYRTRTIQCCRKWFQVRIEGYRPYEIAVTGPRLFLVNHMVGALLDVATLPLLQQERVKILTILKSPKTLNENEKKSWLRPVVPFGDILDLTGFLYVPHGGGFCEALRLCREAFRDGYHVLTYPEGKHCGTKRWPREWRSIPRVQHGCFEIARQTQTPIVPILIGGDRDHFGWCNPGPLDILYLREFNPRDYSSTATLAEAIRTEMNVGLARLAAHRSRE